MFAAEDPLTFAKRVASAHKERSQYLCIYIMHYTSSMSIVVVYVLLLQAEYEINTACVILTYIGKLLRRCFATISMWTVCQ